MSPEKRERVIIAMLNAIDEGGPMNDETCAGMMLDAALRELEIAA